MGNYLSAFKGMQRSDPIWVLVGVLTVVPRVSVGETYADEWGPPVGSKIPVLAANDHNGVARTLDNLAGEHGLLLFMVRSADW